MGFSTPSALCHPSCQAAVPPTLRRVAQTARVVILTALPTEYRAIRTKLKSPRPELDAGGTVYTVGTFNGSRQWEVVVAEVGAGNIGSALHAERAISWFRPNLIMFVGSPEDLRMCPWGTS